MLHYEWVYKTEQYLTSQPGKHSIFLLLLKLMCIDWDKWNILKLNLEQLSSVYSYSSDIQC